MFIRILFFVGRVCLILILFSANSGKKPCRKIIKYIIIFQLKH